METYTIFDKELGDDLGTQSHQLACHQGPHHQHLHRHHHPHSLTEPQPKRLTQIISLRRRQLKQLYPKKSTLGSLATRVDLHFTFRFRTFLHTNIVITSITKLVGRTGSILGKVYPSIGKEVPDWLLPWQMRPSDDIVVEAHAASQNPSLGVNHSTSASRNWIAGNGLEKLKICLKAGGSRNFKLYTQMYILNIHIYIYVYIYMNIYIYAQYIYILYKNMNIYE